MINIEELIKEYNDKGYKNLYASSKACQDIIIYEISKSEYFKNVTFKGGVVMHNLSNDKRRATRDIDIDFIRYSLDDTSIAKFINVLNINDDGIKITISGRIEKLHHQDYDGKRTNVIIKDSFGNELKTKLDIGVHKNFNINQEEFMFDLDTIGTSAKLFINSPEQIFIEKLKSLLKFGPASTRYKDIFDFYYLINYFKLDVNLFNNVLNELIFNDETMNVKDTNEILEKLKFIFSNKYYLKELGNAKNNWIEEDISKVINSILNFFENLK